MSEATVVVQTYVLRALASEWDQQADELPDHPAARVAGSTLKAAADDLRRTLAGWGTETEDSDESPWPP